MKLRLPTLLASAILATFPSFTASADVIGSGVVYDVGKNHYGYNHSVPGHGYIEDDMQCWAAAGSNAVQYWQDTYYGRHDEGITVPNGVIGDSPYAPPAGTRYLRVYEKELEYMSGNWGSESANFFNWWMNGTEVPGNLNSGKGAYYGTVFGDNAAGLAYKGLDDQWGAQFFYEGEPVPVFTPEGLGQMHQELTDFIVTTFQTQGQIATLNVNYGHAITCVGYETDENGLLSALILTNSDDAHFGAFRASIVREQTDPLSLAAMGWEDLYQTYGERLVLKTDDDEVLQLNATYGTDSPTVKPWVSGAARIDTPEDIAIDATPAQSTVTAGETLAVNSLLIESQTVEGNGIVAGNGEQAMILTSAKVTEDGDSVVLSLDGETATGNHTGMTLQEGSMVSLYNLTVENYTDGGVDNGTKMYLHNGRQNISNNTKAGNGAGISNQNYFELQDNTSVAITGNSATNGKGGGIDNGENATLSIRCNDEVIFSENSAARGGGIHNAGKLVLSRNGAVTFSNNTADEGSHIYNAEGAVAEITWNDKVLFTADSAEDSTVVNKGTMHLAAGDGQEIQFHNTALDTTQGSLSLGCDTAGKVEATTLSFTAGESPTAPQARTAVSSLGGLAADLSGTSLSVDTIAGGSAAQLTPLNNVAVTTNTDLVVKDVALGTNVQLAETSAGHSLTLSNVEIDLGGASLTSTANEKGGQDYVFDLRGMLSGSVTLSGVVFDAGAILGEEIDFINKDRVCMMFGDATCFPAESDGITIAMVGRGGSVERYAYKAIDGGNVYFGWFEVPEPATGTLSLLALCALAARRRRK